MSRTSRSRKKTGPMQYLVIALIVATLLYQFWQTLSQDNAEALSQSPTATAAESLVQTQPSSEKPSLSQPTAALEADQASVTTTAGVVPSGDFDYFVMALSWSPEYCASDGQDDSQQCAIGRQLGFVLHGLWPQYNQGYPSNCTNERLDSKMITTFRGLYPNDGLFSHEWEKHGTCAGLTQQQYFILSQQMKESVTIPEAFQKPQSAFRSTSDSLEEAFSAANPEFSSSSVAVYCSSSGRYLKEVYVCLAKDGHPIDCGSDVLKKAAKSCQSADFIVRNIR